MIDVFQFSDYKTYLRDLIEAKREVRGYQSLLAKAGGCQRSFLSQALHSHIHLTPDHAAGIAAFIPLGELGSEYFLELVSLARAGTPGLRSMIQKRLRALARSKFDLGRRFKAPLIARQRGQAEYYSSWHWCALHVLSSVPKFQTTRAMAERLSLSIEFVERSLARLEEMGLVEKKRDGKWGIGKKSVHLSKQSPWLNNHHANWRGKALLNAQHGDDQALHYTAIQALSVADAEKLKDLILATIENTREIVAASPEEELVCFNCDLFKV